MFTFSHFLGKYCSTLILGKCEMNVGSHNLMNSEMSTFSHFPRKCENVDIGRHNLINFDHRLSEYTTYTCSHGLVFKGYHGNSLSVHDVINKLFQSRTTHKLFRS